MFPLILIAALSYTPPDWNSKFDYATNDCPSINQMFSFVQPTKSSSVIRKYSVTISRPRLVYNVSSPWRTWTYPGMHSRANLINHLLSGEHAGKFTRVKLETLSYGQLYNLHCNDHDQAPYRYSNSSTTVRRRSTSTSTTRIVQPQTKVYYQIPRGATYCPTGT
jgi:hypothetical protein